MLAFFGANVADVIAVAIVTKHRCRDQPHPGGECGDRNEDTSGCNIGCEMESAPISDRGIRCWMHQLTKVGLHDNYFLSCGSRQPV